MNDERKDAILADESTKRLWDSLGNVIGLLATASNILSQAIDMPFADPDDIVWVEFQERPYINEVIDVFGQILDAKTTAQKTIDLMATNTVMPDIRYMEGSENEWIRQK